MIVLRDYQQSAADALRRSYGTGARAPLLVAPTGAGKTILFSYVAYHAALRGRRTLILVHRRELVSQTSRTLEQFGVPHGLIVAGLSWRPEGVQVASVQTLARRLDRLGDRGEPWVPDLIVVDEAHHATGRSQWGAVLRHWPRAMVLGVTATPERLDGQGLGVSVGGFFDDLILGPSVQTLVERGFLSRPVVFAPEDAQADTAGVHARGGDFVRAEAAARVDKPRLHGDVVRHYTRLLDGAPAVAFCVTVAHAEHVATMFRTAGYQAVSLDGNLPDRERRQRIRDLGAGQINVLTSCEIISEGTDIPIVAGAILLRPTQSLGLYLQQVGRALRPFPGKERAVVQDHVGNVFRHGLPDEDRAWSLDAVSRHKRKRAAKQEAGRMWLCAACGAHYRPAPICPSCGLRPAWDQTRLELVDGELREVDPKEVARRRLRARARARSLDELKALEVQFGYKPGWAEHVWNSRANRGRRAA